MHGSDAARCQRLKRCPANLAGVSELRFQSLNLGRPVPDSPQSFGDLPSYRCHDRITFLRLSLGLSHCFSQPVELSTDPLQFLLADLRAGESFAHFIYFGADNLGCGLAIAGPPLRIGKSLAQPIRFALHPLDRRFAVASPVLRLRESFT
jgi:hypothetical protein